MQRKAIRATVGATDVDIPIHTFLDGQALVYESGAITTGVRVKVVGTPTAGNVAVWFNVESITDSGISLANVVTTTATPSANTVPAFTGVGKLVLPTDVLIVGQAVSNVTTLNTKTVSSIVEGPASSTSGNLASFNGTTGKVVQDAGLPTTNIVTSTSTPTANQVATFTGTGKAIQNVTVTITAGAITNVTSINTIDPATWVVGPASAVNNNIAGFNGTTGKLIKDTGILSTDLVTAAAATFGAIATFTGTGKAIQATALTISGTTIGSSTTLTIADSLRGIPVSRIARSPGFAITVNEVVAFATTTLGNELGGTGILYTDLVTSTATITANRLTSWTGSGKAIQGTSISVSAGVITGVTSINGITFSASSGALGNVTAINAVLLSNNVITNVASINGVVVEAHGDRHAPGSGTDTGMFSGSSWVYGDVPRADPGGTSFHHKFMLAAVMSSLAVSTTSVEPTGAFVILPARSGGNFYVEWNFFVTFGDTSGNIEVKVSWTSGTGLATATWAGIGSQGTTTTATVMALPSSATISATQVRVTLGLTGVGSSCNIHCAFRKSSGVGFTVLTNGTLLIVEAE